MKEIVINTPAPALANAVYNGTKVNIRTLPITAEKIVMGRINKFYEEICLVDQEFVKDSSMKVAQVLKDATVVEFARFDKGEGIEKKEENFAEEVMKQLQ